MTGTINERFRQRLLIRFLTDNNIAQNVYLVFSQDTTRESADVTTELSRVTPTSMHDQPNSIIAKYAIRIDTSNKLKFAIEEEDPSIIGEIVSVDDRRYIINDNILSPNQLDKLWTSAYFNTPISTSDIQTKLSITDLEDAEDFAKANYNVVSVAINLNATAETIGFLSSAVFTNSEIIMQNRPSLKNLLNIKDAQFPGLIRF